jgi:hypothetical protein
VYIASCRKLLPTSQSFSFPLRNPKTSMTIISYSSGFLSSSHTQSTQSAHSWSSTGCRLTNHACRVLRHFVTQKQSNDKTFDIALQVHIILTLTPHP